PVSLLRVVEETPVAGFVTMMFAPGTTAPALSITVPLMVPRPDWANTGTHPSTSAPTIRKDKLRIDTSDSLVLSQAESYSLISLFALGTTVIGEVQAGKDGLRLP